MTRFQFSVALLFVLIVVFVASLVAWIPLMPDRMAPLFGAVGRPNGWMTRTQHLLFMSAIGLGFPLFIITICRSARYLPMAAVNIPHKDYWMADKRRLDSMEYLYHHSIWLGCLGSAFLTAL